MVASGNCFLKSLMTDTPELLVIIPVFNEEASLDKVVRDWFTELERVTGNFLMLVIDDGSVDNTLSVLNSLINELGSKITAVTRPNKGHGQTCLEGYRHAAKHGIPFVLQIDSDGQCDPQFFDEFWKLRPHFDVIYGKRRREDGSRRILASFVLRWLLRVGFKVDCVDPNVPYRLMRTKACEAAFLSIPEDFFLANVALSILLKRNDTIRHGEVPICFRERTGGEPSVPLSRFALKAFELFSQLRGVKLAPETKDDQPRHSS